MKKIILTHVLFSLFVFRAQAQIIQENDTLYLNYSIAPTEFGVIYEGLIIYFDDNKLMAKSVRYDVSRTHAIPLVTDSIINFYMKNKNNYTIMKAEWVLSKEQEKYIVKVLDEIMKQTAEEDVFSNASEHYTVLSKDRRYVFIDRAGRWKKYREIKKVLDIKHISNFKNEGSRKKNDSAAL